MSDSPTQRDEATPDTRAQATPAPATLDDPLLGTIVADRYVIKHRLARGGMAAVYVADDQRLSRLVALKVMHPHLAEDAQFIARFDREARSAAKISHPAVVTVNDQGFVDGRPFLVMDLVNGHTLRELLRTEGAFTVDNTLKWTHDILQALRAAARENVIHRDIKPENVLIPIEGSARVTDFGLARAATEVSMSMTNTMLGTVTYMAPEIATAGVADSRTDLYSVGIMVYEMLTGEVPWHGENPMHIAYAHVHEDVPVPSTKQPWIPREIDDFVAALTARDPDERPRSAQEALHLLDRLRLNLPDEVLTLRSDVVGQPLPRKGAEVPLVTRVDDDPLAEDQVASIVETPEQTDGLADQANATQIIPTIRPSSLDEHPTSLLPAVIPAAGATAAQAGGTTSAPAGGATSWEASSLTADSGDDATTVFPAVARQEIALPDDEPESTALVAARTSTSLEERPSTSGKKILITALVLALVAMLGLGGTWWWQEYGPGSYLPMPVTDGRPLSDVQTDLAQLGLLVEVSEEFSDTVALGHVISSTPESEGSVHKNAAVQLVVSKGVDLREVPKLTGSTRAAAQEALLKAGLKSGAITEEWSEDIPAGHVISQTPEPGKKIRVDSSVSLVASKGREPRKVPSLNGKTKAEIEELLAELELVPEPTEVFSDTVPAGTLISQETPADTELFRGDHVKFTLSKGPELVEVPSVVGLSRADAVAKLEAAGFNVEVHYLVGGLFGLAHSTDPAGGTMLKKGSTIILNLV